LLRQGGYNRCAPIMVEVCENSVRHFISRQPVFDRLQQVHSYQLLFRDGWDIAVTSQGNDPETAGVLNNALNVTGIRLLLMGRKGFVLFSRNALLAQEYRVFPVSSLVVELSPDIQVDPPVLAACRELREQGYELAINCASPDDACRSLIESANYVRIDMTKASRVDALRVSTIAGDAGVPVIACNIDSATDYVAAIELHTDYIQGRFYCESQVIESRDIPSCKRNYMTFLREVQQPQLDYSKIENIVRREVSLSVKLLRYLNTVAMGMGEKVESIHHAVTLLGERPLRRWASLVAVTCLGDDRTPELLVTTLVRARMCEQLAEPAGLGHRAFDLFMTGLFSTLDALLDRPLDELLIEMPLSIDVKAVLLGAMSPIGMLLQLTIACERGDIARIDQIASSLKLERQQVSDLSQEALQWAQSVI